MSGQVSRGSAGEYQADERAGVAGPGSIPGSGRSPGEGNSNPLQYSCLENPGQGTDGQRNLVGYSPWGHKESDKTERLHFHYLFGCIGS